MRLLLLVLTLAPLLAAASLQQPSSRELDHLASFARLYGVMRYFYPSDAAAALDWNSFAVQGVRQVRAARDTSTLETTLKTLFQWLGPRIEIGATLPPRSESHNTDGPLIAWRYLGAAVAPSTGFSAYQAKRTHRASKLMTTIDGFVTLLQNVPAAALRGKAIRLRGHVRAATAAPEGSAALWLRVDGPDGKSTFFDNMGDRPIRDAEWREYTIDGTVADGAVEVFFGVMASGNVTADFDTIDLSVRGEDGTWSSVTIGDNGFEANSSSSDWRRAGTSKTARIGRVSEGAPQGAQFLRLAPPTPSERTLELFQDEAPTASAHIDLDLGSGLKARVPLTLSESEATANGTPLTPQPFGLNDPETRFADVIVAWNIFRHFYPYWREAAVDWDARLRAHLALVATTRDQHRDVLRQLVADARDGHGSVVDTTATAARAFLPVRFAVVEGQLVITAATVAADAPVGTVVAAVDGVPATQRLAQLTRLASGTSQWKNVRATQELTSCLKGTSVTLSVADGRGVRTLRLQCDAAQPPTEHRPEPVSEIGLGVWYVDLTRATAAHFKPQLGKLAQARGVVFDVRGYPTESGSMILPYLIDGPEQDRWMHVAKIVGPFGQMVGWQSLGWNLKPTAPRLTGTIVFLTDGRAISYAESVMGYIADRKLGTIIGSTTAGANGNVATFSVPGGFRVTFTGMRVTRHDGETSHHLVGITPHIQVQPTVAGLRAGRDEVLVRAIALIDGR